LQVGAGAGGRQDRIARTLAKYLTKYTAGNPVFLIQSKSGGQGIPAMLALSKVPTDGSAFEQMFTGKEGFEDVKLYTDWQPEIMSMYKRLAHEAPEELRAPFIPGRPTRLIV